MIDLLKISKLDIILIEGYSESNKPKIEIIRKEISDKSRCSENELIAVVSDVDFNIQKFDIDDIYRITNFIEPTISIIISLKPKFQSINKDMIFFNKFWHYSL